MRIAISAQTNNELESQVAQHFGRCPYFALVDLEGNQIKAVTIVDNPYYSSHRPGQVPEFIKNHGAQVMLSGGMGGRAIQFFNQFGITAATGAAGTIQSAVNLYLRGELREAAPCAESVEHGHGGEHHHQ